MNQLMAQRCALQIYEGGDSTRQIFTTINGSRSRDVDEDGSTMTFTDIVELIRPNTRLRVVHDHEAPIQRN